MKIYTFRYECILLVIMCFFVILGSRNDAYTQNMTDSQLNAISSSFQALSEMVSPSVVQVFATGYTLPQGISRSESIISRQLQSGSGVILDSDGFIVTNAHVVNGALRVQVLLAARNDGGPPGKSILKPRGKMLDAEIVALDEETDLAVLKVPETGLPALELGDSDELRPGQLVFAFGSPLGLENSVSMGIISSVARQLEPEAPMIYIQTDASINPGNSGGPLVDTNGRVIGINTFILSQSGGNEGISFAVPSNIVRNVYFQIRVTGKVRRGEIGVHAQTITSAMARGLELQQNWGVILGDVFPGGPADRVGLQPGDIVLTLNGKIMENGRQFDINLYNRSIGDVVTLEVLRDFETQTFRVPVFERQDDPDRFFKLVNPKEHLIPELGIFALDLNDIDSKMLPPLRSPYGMVVASSSSDFSSIEGRLLPGDIIYALNKHYIRDIADLRSEVAELKAGDSVIAHLQRRGLMMFVTLEIQ